jgi:hypothetical protein
MDKKLWSAAEDGQKSITLDIPTPISSPASQKQHHLRNIIKPFHKR